MRIQSRLFLAVLFVASLCTLAASAAVEIAPSHQCLPDETVVVVRVPEGLRFVEALRSETKLGQVLLSARRFEGAASLIREKAADGLTEFTESLAKYNLKIEDFPKLFDKEIGFAVTLEPRRGKYPVVVGLAWAEPEADLAGRILAAIQQVVQEDESGIRRVDFNVEGHDCMHLSMPAMGPAKIEEVAPNEFQGLDAEGIKERLAERRKKQDDAKQVEIDQVHVFITRLGDRLLVANTFPQSANEVRKLLTDDPEKKIDFAAITGADEAKGAFARFVAAHSGPPAGLTPRVMSTRGLAAALPDGLPLVEVLFAPEPLLKLASEAESPTVARVLKQLGIDRLGPGALRVSFDRDAMRVGLFLSAPEPRQGLMALLDQPSFVPDPPAWVPATVMGYGQLSFDLSKAYTFLRDLLVGESGDQVRMMVNQVEQQIQSVTQTDVATLLSSIGQNHHFLMYPPTMAKVAPAEGIDVEAPATRSGIVWQLKDEAPWKRLIQLGAGFAALTDGAITPAEEQGFVGLRLKVEDMFTGGVFVGHGYMILGIGPDVLEPLMSAVRTPLEGSAALRGSELAKRASALLPSEPSIYYQVTDFDQYIRSLRQTIISMFDLSTASWTAQLAGLGDEPEAKPDEDTAKTVARIKELLPTEQELEGTAGASVGQIIVNEHGLTYRGAVELPR
jgi:hypothetical protein